MTWQVVDAVEEKLHIKNKHRAKPVYLGEDPSFRHLKTAVNGLEILITSGPVRHGRRPCVTWLACC